MIRAAALCLTVLTGATALVYQVAWQKYMAAMLGAHSEATATVLGVFLGGLSAGYVLFGRVARRRVEHLLRTYGAVEAGIGLYAIAFPLLFSLLRSVSLWRPIGSDVVSFGLDVVLTALLVGPPAVLMGGTIPLLTQGLARNLEDATRLHALVYAFNTVGAFAGALLAGFYLVPTFGLNALMLAMGALNLAVGALFVGLDRHAPPAFTIPEDRSASSPPDVAIYSAVALLSGFGMMTLQTVVNRVAAFSLGASPFTFSMVVATFVLCIALGSFAVSALPRIPPLLLVVSQWALVAYLLVLYPAMADAPYWAHVCRTLFRDSVPAFYAYNLAVFAAMFGMLAVPVALSGATLPLVFHHLRRRPGGLGDTAGRVYGWNTVGSLLGALLGGYALLFWLDLHQVYRLAVSGVAAGAALLLVSVLGRLGAGIAAAVALIVLAVLPAWPADQLAAGPFRTRQPTDYSYGGPERFFENYRFKGEKLLFYDDDPVASIAVLELPYRQDVLSRAVITNGKNDSALPGDHLTTGMLALLPAILADRCERAFVVGYGTGNTVGELAALQSVSEVVVAEIARGVIRAAPLFEARNQHAATNPKTRIVRGDAFRALLRSRGGFDVITSEPSNPWVAGVEMLYSREFLEAARERLAPGGVFTQWIHFYELDDPTLGLVLNTYRQVFGRVAVWHGTKHDLLLVGFRDPAAALDPDAIARRFAREDFRAGYRRVGLDSLPALLAHELLPAGVLHEIDLQGPTHTLLHPILSFRAAKAFFAGGTAALPPSLGSRAAAVGARRSLVRRMRARVPPSRLDEFRGQVAEETCVHWPRLCATLLAEWRHEAPESPALAEALGRIGRAQSGTDLSQPLLNRLGTLFDPQRTAGLPGEYALRVYDTFSSYYHHAAPFDARALRGPLGRCTEPRCAETLKTALDLGVALPVAADP